MKENKEISKKSSTDTQWNRSREIDPENKGIKNIRSSESKQVFVLTDKIVSKHEIQTKSLRSQKSFMETYITPKSQTGDSLFKKKPELWIGENTWHHERITTICTKTDGKQQNFARRLNTNRDDKRSWNNLLESICDIFNKC